MKRYFSKVTSPGMHESLEGHGHWLHIDDVMKMLITLGKEDADLRELTIEDAKYMIKEY